LKTRNQKRIGGIKQAKEAGVSLDSRLAMAWVVIGDLIKLIIDSKTATAKANPKLIPYSPPQIEIPEFVEIGRLSLEKNAGKYVHRFLGK
jgi:hypothetical protein